MKKLIFLLIIFALNWSYAQFETPTENYDAKYLEDQFYLGVTYNFLLDKPQDVTQRNLSYGLQAGFIKDIPINTDRTFGIGIGLGYGVNSYYSNIISSETDNGISYARAGDDFGIKRSKIETHLVEVPFELRWRGSNAKEFKFWRVYTGVKFAYAFESRTKVVDNLGKYSFGNPDVRKFQYGLMLNVGYNTFNVHVYYALNNLLNDNISLNQEQINIKPLRVGFIFYIL